MELRTVLATRKEKRVWEKLTWHRTWAKVERISIFCLSRNVSRKGSCWTSNVCRNVRNRRHARFCSAGVLSVTDSLRTISVASLKAVIRLQVEDKILPSCRASVREFFKKRSEVSSWSKRWSSRESESPTLFSFPGNHCEYSFIWLSIIRVGWSLAKTNFSPVWIFISFSSLKLERWSQLSVLYLLVM